MDWDALNRSLLSGPPGEVDSGPVTWVQRRAGVDGTGWFGPHMPIRLVVPEDLNHVAEVIIRVRL